MKIKMIFKNLDRFPIFISFDQFFYQFSLILTNLITQMVFDIDPNWKEQQFIVKLIQLPNPIF